MSSDVVDPVDTGTAARLDPEIAGRLDPEIAARLRRDQLGLVAAVVQETGTGEVLMLGWMDDEALRRTLTTGRATYYSRSRGEYWVKGETSGHRQRVRSVALDCDGDALLLTVDQEGHACHTGAHSCFSNDLAAVVGEAPVVGEAAVLGEAAVVGAPGRVR